MRIGGGDLLCGGDCHSGDIFESSKLIGVRICRERIVPSLADAAGMAHCFHFEMRLLGDHTVALEAFELVNGAPGGYQFQVIGDAEGDLFDLMGQMVQRIRRLLAQQHLKTEPHMPGLHIADTLVRGRITWDENEEGRLPMLVIDGREISWEQFGRMVMGFEGWQFRFEIRDRSEEV